MPEAKTTSETSTEDHTADPTAVFTANLNALNNMQQKVFCMRAQQVDDPAQQKRLLDCSQAITDLITDFIG